jgi:hypothetical protein
MLVIKEAINNLFFKSTLKNIKITIKGTNKKISGTKKLPVTLFK